MAQTICNTMITLGNKRIPYRIEYKGNSCDITIKNHNPNAPHITHVAFNFVDGIFTECTLIKGN